MKRIDSPSNLLPIVKRPPGGWPWVRVVHRRMAELGLSLDDLLPAIGWTRHEWGIRRDYDRIWRVSEVEMAEALRWSTSDLRSAVENERLARAAEALERSRGTSRQA